MLKNLILFGGTFDPVHCGHLNIAIKVQQAFHFEQFNFLPCKLPVLKNASSASAADRVAMLSLAIENYKQDAAFFIDEREINRKTPSYMIYTLEDIRKEYKDSLALTLMLGADAFMHLPQWYQWQKIITLANLLIIAREPTMPLDATLISLLEKHETQEKKYLLKASHGYIYRFDAGNYPISSTLIRHHIASHKALDLPKKVEDYIFKNHLYASSS